MAKFLLATADARKCASLAPRRAQRGGVLRSVITRRYVARSLSSRRKIFPDADFGIASMNSTPPHLLIRCDALGDVGHQLLCGRGASQHDERARDFAALGIRERHDRRVRHRRMRQQHGLELRRRHLQSLVLDQLLHPVDDEEVAVVVHAADVARAQPPFAVHHRPRLGQATQVTAHDLRTANPNLAVRAGRDVGAGFDVDDARFRVRNGPADRSRLDRRVLRGDERRGARFREAISLLQDAADAACALLGDVVAERRRPREQLADRREVAPRDGRMLGDREDDGWDDVQHRGAMPLHEIEVVLEVELRHDDQRHARPHAHQHDDGEAVDVKERQERDRRVRSVDVVPGVGGLQDVRDEVAMREHHAFRQARRAARIRQRDEIVRIDRDARRSTRHRDERVESQHFSVDLRGHRAGVVEHHHMLDGRARDRLCPDRRKHLRREQDARARIPQLFREIVLRIRAGLQSSRRHPTAQSPARQSRIPGSWPRRSRRRRPSQSRARRDPPRFDRRAPAAPRTKRCVPSPHKRAPGVRPAPRRGRARTRRAAWPGCRAADEGCGT